MSKTQDGYRSSSRHRHPSQAMTGQLSQTSSQRSSSHRTGQRGQLGTQPHKPARVDSRSSRAEEPYTREQHRSRPVQKHLDRPAEDVDLELEEMRNEISRLIATENTLLQQRNQLENEIETTREELKARETRRKELKGITQELAVAQRFLSRVDTLSQAEVVRAMEALNEEIFQLASIAADEIQLEAQRSLTDEESAKYQALIRQRVLGPSFLDVVSHRQLEDVLAIQIGWQATLSSWCKCLIESWDFGDREVNDGLYTMSRRIQPRIAGHWRSLTLSSIDDPLPEAREKEIRYVIQEMVALVAFCGYVRFHQPPYATLVEALSERLTSLFDECLKFRRMVKEGITSVDVTPYVIKSGVEHESQFADLDYEDQQKNGNVACCLSMGLFSVDRLRVEEDTQAARTPSINLKPKVILWETLEGIISI